jgi:hypothetical protein
MTLNVLKVFLSNHPTILFLTSNISDHLAMLADRNLADRNFAHNSPGIMDVCIYACQELCLHACELENIAVMKVNI